MEEDGTDIKTSNTSKGCESFDVDKRFADMVRVRGFDIGIESELTLGLEGEIFETEGKEGEEDIFFEAETRFEDSARMRGFEA